jgi:hypothetical protein
MIAPEILGKAAERIALALARIESDPGLSPIHHVQAETRHEMSLSVLVLGEIDELRARHADLLAERRRLALRCDTRGLRDADRRLRYLTTLILAEEAGL